MWSGLQTCSSAEEVKLARRFNPQIAATLEGYPDDEVWSRIAVMRHSDDQVDKAESPRLAKFAMLASGQPVIGTPTPDALLHAETLPRPTWDPSSSPLLRGISSLVAIHRLREVACHGCLVIAETSCESRNLFLDRALLVDTVGPFGIGFLEP